MKPCLSWHCKSSSVTTNIVLLMQDKDFYNNDWIQNRIQNLHLHDFSYSVLLQGGTIREPHGTSGKLTGISVATSDGGSSFAFCLSCLANGATKWITHNN